jgi:GDP-4-dehydro-6-deoxy-D-mannose reductase
MIDVIVTGAQGFIGQSVVKLLRENGYNLLTLNHVDGDIASENTWDGLPEARSVIHLAGRSFVPESWKMSGNFIDTNVVGTQRALDYCKEYGARMIYANAYIYGIPKHLPIAESDPINPNNPYAMSKHIGEQLCEFANRYQNVSATVLRIFNVYGSGQKKNFLIPSLVRQVLNNKEVNVMDLEPRRDYIHTQDVANAFIKSIDAPDGFNCVNIGSGVSYSVQEVIEIIQFIAGTNLPIVSKSLERFQEIPDVIADISKAKKILKWEPTITLEEGLSDMLKVLKS